MDKLGLGPLGRRFAKEAGDLAEGWTEAYGLGSFLSSFQPDHELHCMAAKGRWDTFVELLQEVVHEFEEQRTSYSLKANLELAVLNSHVTTIAKAQTAIRKLTPSVQAGLAEIAPDMRRRARDVLERISARCSEAAGPKAFGLYVISMTCRPDLKEAVGSLAQLGFAQQAQRLEMAFDEMVDERNRGFTQDIVNEIEARRPGTVPPPKNADEEADKQVQRWFFQRAVSDLGKVALDLLDLVKPTGEPDVTSAAPRGDEPRGDAKRNGETPPGGVQGGDVQARDIRAETEPSPRQVIDDVVTLEQAAALAKLSKRTCERYVDKGKLPSPDFPGGGGKAHKWKWSTLRPNLEKVANRPLPERFPGSRII